MSKGRVPWPLSSVLCNRQEGSQYFVDYHEIMQGNPTEQQEGNAPEQQLVVQQEENTGEVCKCKHI